MKYRKPGSRLVTASTLLSLVLTGASGCSLFDFGAHDSFDEWYSGPRDSFDPNSIGCTSLDGGFCGYVLNDVLLRTPVLLVYETTRTALVPLAASCFAVRSVLDGDDGSGARPQSEEDSIGENTEPQGSEDTAPETEESTEPQGSEEADVEAEESSQPGGSADADAESTGS